MVIQTLDTFYRSKEWEKFRQIIIGERMRDDGFVYDEVTGKPILKNYDIILHHIEELTEENVNDVDIALNPDNIQIVSHKTHNILHNKLGYSRRQVFLVYGSPLSGKTSWVKDNMNEGDLIVDIDSIWQCVSGLERYNKPKRLNAIVFQLRDDLIDAIKYRLGRWSNAYLIGGYPLSNERERLCKELGAREIYIDTPKEECIKRLDYTDRDSEEWKKYIDEWWDRYTRP